MVVEAIRTPLGNFGGSLRDIPVVQMGSLVVSQVLRRKGLRPIPPEENVRLRPSCLEKGMTDLEKRYYAWDDSAKEIAVDEVILGNVLQAGQG